MNKNFESGSPGVAAYTSLLAVQIVGALVFVWKELPAFNYCAIRASSFHTFLTTI
jgi:hypothetical protein